MTAHTPGPWRLPFHDAETLIRVISADGVVVATVGDSWHGLTDQQRADASRIVACVNACEGMENPHDFITDLENVSVAYGKRGEVIRTLRAERDALRLEVERNGEAIKLVADQADAWRLERDALRAALQGMVNAFCPRVDITVAREGGKALHPAVRRALQVLGSLLPDDQDSAALAQGSEK